MANERLPITGILLAAGRGKRLRPYTDITPKPLLLNNNRPIIDYVLDALNAANIKNLYIVTNYLEDQVISHVSHKYKDQFNMTFCHQENINGPANAVSSVSNYLKKEMSEKRPLLISASDYLMPHNYIKDLIQCHLNNKADITISLRKITKEKMRYSSSVMLKNKRVVEIIEKPENIITEPFLAASLIYIVPALIFKYLIESPLSKRGEYELPDIINLMIDDGLCAEGCFQSELFDMDSHVQNAICNNVPLRDKE